MGTVFTPPGLDKHEGPARFVPPSLNSHEGPKEAASPKSPNFWDSFVKQVTTGSPLNPANWADMVKSAFESPFSDEHMAEAERQAEILKSGKAPALQPGEASAMAGEGAGHLTNAALTALLTAGIMKGYGAAASRMGALAEADPALDLIKTYNPKDPRFKERAPGAVADIKRAAGTPVTSNEHLSSVSPQEVISPALAENRSAWDKYFAPAEQRGVQRHGNPIIDATEQSLKGSIAPEQAKAVLDEAQRRYGRNIGVRELQEMLNEKNGELQPFYSKNEAVRGAAEQAGALTGRSQALLEAQGKAIRNTLYEALDPENGGAGPREIQRRYGAVKMLSNEANDARNAILAEHAGTPAGKIGKTILAAADVLTSPLREGGLTEGFLKVPQQFRGASDPIIARAFRNAPEWQPYPEPNQPRVAGYLPPGSVLTPPPEDASFVRGAPAVAQPPNPARALPAASTRFAGPVEDESFVRGTPAHEPFRTGFSQRALPAGGQSPIEDMGSQHGDILRTPVLSFRDLMRMKPADLEKLQQQIQDGMKQ